MSSAVSCYLYVSTLPDWNLCVFEASGCSSYCVPALVSPGMFPLQWSLLFLPFSILCSGSTTATIKACFFLFQVCLSSLQFGPLLLYFMTEAETHAECSSGSINTSTHLWVFTKSGLSVWMDTGGKVSPWEITFSWKERCSDTTSHTVTANDKRGIRLKSDLLHHPSLWQLTFSV